MDLIINKSQDVGEKTHFEFVYNPPADLLSFCYHTPTDSAKVTGSYVLNEDDSISLNMKVNLPMRWFCDRCGDSFEKNYYFEYNDDILPENSEDHYSYENNTLTLDHIIDEQIVLNIPSSVLCKPDCAGICPTCGNNRNYSPCDCEEKQINPKNPFAEIKDKLN